jgi:NTE family protein
MKLVLGGGTAYGFAHAGLLKALYEKNIAIDAISGCSMGAIVGAFYYLFDKNGEKVFNFINSLTLLDFVKLIDINNFNYYLKGKKIKHFFYSYFKKLKIGDFKNFFVIAKKLDTGEKIIFDKNVYIVDAIMASCALSPLLPPYKGFIDGGYSEIVPVSVFKGIEDIILASNVYYVPVRNLNFFYKSMEFSLLKQFIRARYECKNADFVIEYDFNNIVMADFTKNRVITKIGYETAKEFLKRNKEIIQL